MSQSDISCVGRFDALHNNNKYGWCILHSVCPSLPTFEIFTTASVKFDGLNKTTAQKRRGKHGINIGR